MTADPDRTYALLADGSTVEIRAARPDDAVAVREMHARMSPDNAYLRFFSLSPRAPDDEARRVCREPGPEHAALLAWLGDQLAGVASYEPSGQDGVAEIAFAVADTMHGRGVATLLLEHLVSLARQRRLRVFTAQTLPENTPMLRVFADAGLPVHRKFVDGVIELTFPLPGADEGELDSYLETVDSRASRADLASLRHLLRPESVAVIGAGRRRSGVGREILRNIVSGGFTGRIYPVNPHATSMEGLTCLPSVADLPVGVDLAVLAVPAASVPDVATECGRRGVRALVVITSGMAEAGADLLAICRRYGMRLAGPNCFGIAVPGLGLDATFGARHPAPGHAGLVVQSGAVGVSLLEHLSRLGIGVSSFASVGDKYDVSSNDLLTWWEHDETTRLAVAYLESFGNPRGFARTARRVARRMPLLTVVGGRSPADPAPAAGAAAPLLTQEALFREAGIITTLSLGELVEAVALLGCQPLPGGDRVAIVSNASGAALLAADACADHGLQVARLGPATRRRLARLLPAGASVAGPVDTTTAVSATAFRRALEAAAADPAADAVLAVTIPTAVGDLGAAARAAAVPKPMAVALLSQAETVRIMRRVPGRVPDTAAAAKPGGAAAAKPGAGAAAKPGAGAAAKPGAGAAAKPGAAAAVKPEAGAAVKPDAAAAEPAAGAPEQLAFPAPALPVYAYPEQAARALAHAYRYQAWKNRPHGRVPELDGVRPGAARAQVTQFLAARPAGGWLPAAGVARLLDCYRIPHVPARAVTGETAAAAAAADLGQPVALRADADPVVGGGRSGAVILDLGADDEVRRAYRELAAAFGPRLRGAVVQPMVGRGVDVLVGVVQEPVFGPLVVFGLAGAAAEMLGDRAARLTPLTDADAGRLVREVRAAPLLFGHRGSPPVDTVGLEDLLLRVSLLADDLPEVAELELNPVIAAADGVRAAAARIRVSPAAPRDPFLRRLR